MESKSKISRRQFIQQSSLAAATITAGGLAYSCKNPKSGMSNKGMPLRVFGKTGEKISILGYGCGSQFMRMPDGEWEKSMEYAFEQGINYFDTAATYGKDDPEPSEIRVGRFIPSIRKEIFLLTKMREREPDKAKAQFEQSLQRLNTDHVDFLMIHSIQPEDDVASIENGVYKVLHSFKEQGMARYIGLTSMDSAERTRDLIQNLDFDLTLLAMNATNYGNFVETTLPSAIEKNLGIISMKVFRNIIDKGLAAPKELLEYNWELPGVAANVVAHTGMDPLKQNIEIAKSYGQQKVSRLDRNELEQRLAHLGSPKYLEWARPYYDDGMIC
jgi:aryl-alcohol dehydrogenase-like predicted oxidoreductase